MSETTGDENETKSAARPAPAPPRGAAKVRLRVRRQDRGDRPDTRRIEEFDVDAPVGATIYDVLRRLRRAPCTADGRAVAPVCFEGSCGEGACGGCAVRVGGVARLACTTLVSDASPKGKPILLEPLGSFPLVRDLVVDRAGLDDGVARVHGWIAADERGAAAAPPEAVTRVRLALAGCSSCGACLDACPQWGDHSDFVGPAALGAVLAANLHPVGILERGARLDALMQPGGVSDCGKAQNCVEVCPSAVPLTDAIAGLSRDVTLRWLFGR